MSDVMKYFLAKTEPLVYSIDDLERDTRTTWDGVRNPQALMAIRAMKPGDKVLIYHSGGVKQIVGIARVRTVARPDPKIEKSFVVDLEFVSRLEPPTSLVEIKATAKFADFALVRQSRLSTMAVPPAFIDWLRTKYPSL